MQDPRPDDHQLLLRRIGYILPRLIICSDAGLLPLQHHARKCTLTDTLVDLAKYEVQTPLRLPSLLSD